MEHPTPGNIGLPLNNVKWSDSPPPLPSSKNILYILICEDQIDHLQERKLNSWCRRSIPPPPLPILSRHWFHHYTTGTTYNSISVWMLPIPLCVWVVMVPINMSSSS